MQIVAAGGQNVNPVTGAIISAGTIAQVANLANLGSSGTAGNATAQNGYTPPTLNLSNGAFNGLPTLNFSGSAALGGFDLSAHNGSAYTVIAVEGKSAAANLWYLGTNAAAANQALHMGYRSDTDFALGQYSNDLDYNSAPSYSGSEVARTWAGELSLSAGHILYLNGTQVASNTNTTPLNGLGGSHYGILGAGPNYGSPYIGDLGEVMIFNSALSSTQVAAVQQYLMAKWTQPDILPTATGVNISGGGKLDLNGATQTIGSLTSSDSTTSVTLGAGQLYVGRGQYLDVLRRHRQRVGQPRQDRQRHIDAHRQQLLLRRDRHRGRHARHRKRRQRRRTRQHDEYRRLWHARLQ